MAFVKGNMITKTGLDAINEPLYQRYYHDGNKGWTYYPGTSGYYCRNKNRTLYFAWYNGVFGGGEFRLQKLENGSWATKVTRTFGWNTNTSGTYSYGEGWYRVYFEGNARKEFRLFWGHYPCVKGSFLRYFNECTSSGHASGTLLTAAILNSGRVGTIA